MIEIMNSWQLNLILSIVLVVFFTQFFKVASRKQKSDGAMTVVAQLIAGISILILIPFYEWKFSTDWKVWLFLGLAIIFYAINDRLHTTTRKNMDVSTENILRQLSKAFIIIVGIVFFKEQAIPMKILGGIIIILSNVLLVMEKGKLVFNKYVVIQLISVVCYTIAIALDIGISGQFNLPIYVALTLIVPAFLIMLAEKISFKDVAEEYKQGDKKSIIIAGITWGFSILFGLKAYQLGTITTVAPLSALSLLINVIIAYFFLKEKDHLLKKIIAATGVIIGVILISFAG